MSLLTASGNSLVDLGHNEPNPLQSNRHDPVSLTGKKILVNGAAGGVGHFCPATGQMGKEHTLSQWGPGSRKVLCVNLVLMSLLTTPNTMLRIYRI